MSKGKVHDPDISAEYDFSKGKRGVYYQRALNTTAGLWRDRSEAGEAYAERLRTGRRLRELYPEAEGDSSEQVEIIAITPDPTRL